jgi:hypothetical protein
MINIFILFVQRDINEVESLINKLSQKYFIFLPDLGKILILIRLADALESESMLAPVGLINIFLFGIFKNT